LTPSPASAAQEGGARREHEDQRQDEDDHAPIQAFAAVGEEGDGQAHVAGIAEEARDHHAALLREREPPRAQSGENG
jgi:hypothetical protein